MIIQPKPQEVIEAQIAAFASERVEHRVDKQLIYANIGTLAQGEICDLSRVTERDEAHPSFEVPEGIVWTFAIGKEYIDFLRTVKGSAYVPIQRRAEMLQNYGNFSPAIARLRDEITDVPSVKVHPDFLGQGGKSDVLRTEVEGKTYAARMPFDPDVAPSIVEKHIAGAVLGAGLKNAEQIVAASYSEGVTVAELIPGKPMQELTADEVGTITDEHLLQLFDLLKSLQDRGIDIDVHANNFIFDPENGFSVIDYLAAKEFDNLVKRRAFATNVGLASVAIFHAGEETLPIYFDDGEQDYRKALLLKQANLDVLIRYRNIVNQKLHSGEQKQAHKIIDPKIQELEKKIKQYSDADWVAQAVAAFEQLMFQPA